MNPIEIWKYSSNLSYVSLPNLVLFFHHQHPPRSPQGPPNILSTSPRIPPRSLQDAALSSKSPEYGEAHPQVSGHHCRARRPDKPTTVPDEFPIDTWRLMGKNSLVTVKGFDGSEIPNNHRLDGWLPNPINNGIIIILGGAGFCPSTVSTNISGI